MEARACSVLVVIMVFVSGCLGSGGESAPAAEAAPADVDTAAPNATLPDGRGQSLGNLETNKTEEGAGGVDHKHDYWGGATEVTLFSEEVTLSFIPLMPDGRGSMPKGVAYVKLAPPTLVYEGASLVTVTISEPRAFVAPEEAGDPAPPTVTMQYRTAADADWRAPVELAWGTAVEIPVGPTETDMPHSTSSLWMWRFTGDRYLESFNVTIVAYRGTQVVDWPGHPDFYADKRERFVLQGDVTSEIQGFPENVMYEGNDWEVPELLISHGTERVEVWANVTAFRSDSPLRPVRYRLNYHNATQGGFETDIFNWVEDAEGKNDLKSYHFVIPVTGDGMDSPYQPMSRWGFRLEAGVGGGEGTPFSCGDCSSYDIDFHITVIAYAAPEPSLPPDESGSGA